MYTSRQFKNEAGNKVSRQVECGVKQKVKIRNAKKLISNPKICEKQFSIIQLNKQDAEQYYSVKIGNPPQPFTRDVVISYNEDRDIRNTLIARWNSGLQPGDSERIEINPRLGLPPLGDGERHAAVNDQFFNHPQNDNLEKRQNTSFLPPLGDPAQNVSAASRFLRFRKLRRTR